MKKNIQITLQNVVAQTPGRYYWKDKNGVYLGCNQDYARQFGYTSIDKVIGKTDHELFSKEDADKLKEADLKIMATGHSTTLHEATEMASFLTQKKALQDESGNIIGIIGLTIDISHMKNISIEHTSNSSNNSTDFFNDIITLEQIFSFFPGHLYWKNKAGYYLGCNEDQAISLGLSSPRDIIGKKDEELAWAKNAEKVRAFDKKVMGQKKVIITEEPLHQYDGTEGTVISTKKPLFNKKGEVIGLMGSSIDITKQKNTEEQLRIATKKANAANYAKNDFIANMSHDLRTPLSGIQALAENIIEKTENSSIEKDASLLLKASQDLSKLIDSILDASRVHDNNDPEKSFNLYTLIDSINNMLRPSAIKKNLALTLKIAPNTPKYLFGKCNALERVIINLLSNAIHFTPDNKSINLDIRPISQNNNNLVLAIDVIDTGIGIAKDKISLIFDKFTRVEESYKSQNTGTGVGLYITREYIKKMSGSIHVTSTLGKGSTFHCEIPFIIDHKKSRLSPQQTTHTKNITTKYRSSPVKVLLVEDNPVASYTATYKLSKLNCKVITANNGAEAKKLFHTETFDLILLDLGLPDIGGDYLCQYFREQSDNKNSQLPIIILTAHITKESGDLNKQLSLATAIKRKPLMTQDAQDIINQYVDNESK